MKNLITSTIILASAFHAFAQQISRFNKSLPVL